MQFSIKFHDNPWLDCEIDPTALGEKYYALLKSQYQQDPNPVFRDPAAYTLEHFRSLIDQARLTLGWDWDRPTYDLDTTTLLHKDIERYLSGGYGNVPTEHDALLDELHFCLHSVESGSRRSSWLQIEWFNDNGFPISAPEYPGKINLQFGDLRLQNPYVGHHPLYIYEQNDSHDVSQTCRFHDFVKPGINLVISRRQRQFDWDHYQQWWHTNAPEFLASHGWHKIQDFTGHPVVGRVKDLYQLRQLMLCPALVLDTLQF